MDIKNYEINKNLSINVFDDVNLEGKIKRNLPEYIQFYSIYGLPNKSHSGRFLCGFNNMTTLRGCPEYVTWYFSCANNNLTSLEYAPKKASNFYCHDNAVSSIPHE